MCVCSTWPGTVCILVVAPCSSFNLHTWHTALHARCQMERHGNAVASDKLSASNSAAGKRLPLPTACTCSLVVNLLGPSETAQYEQPLAGTMAASVGYVNVNMEQDGGHVSRQLL